MFKSWMAEMQGVGEISWHANGLRFATEGEARTYAIDLFSRWMGAQDWRVRPSEDEVTHKIVDGVMSSL